MSDASGTNTGPAAGDVDVASVLDGLEIVLQPVVEVATGAMLAVEALARFTHAPGRAVSEILAEAHQAGFGYTLEAACLRAALNRRPELPDGVLLAVNLSPDVLHHPVIARGWDTDLDGVVVEVTEHVSNRPAALRDQLAHLRLRGAAIAVDDVGTGYAGLLRLATMRPDYVKIDRTVVSGVRDSAAKSAVLEALVTFSHRLGSAVIGEGVESMDDLVSLAEFDVEYGQGWALGRPAATIEPISPLAVATCIETRGYVLERSAATSVSTAYTHGMHAVTSALSSATGLAEVHAATTRAAAEIGVDIIGVSVLGRDGVLREISASGAAIDTAGYAVTDYPATRTALQTGNTVEIHVNDPDADAAEKTVLQRLGHASMLMIPLYVGDQPVGVLEFAHRSHRRWTTNDIAHGRGLAAHLGHALVRIRS